VEGIFYLTETVSGGALNSAHSHEKSLLTRVKNDQLICIQKAYLCVRRRRIYRDLACIRFRRWIYRVPRGHVTNGVPACALDRIQKMFPAEDSCSFAYPRWAVADMPVCLLDCWLLFSGSGQYGWM